jgi:hypothetical protein
MNSHTSYDVTSSFARAVDADCGAVEELLGRIDPMRSLADRLSALGLDDRAIWSQNDERSYTLVWRFPEGHARLDWQIEVGRYGNGRTTLTVKLAGRGSTTVTRGRLLAAWTLLEELAQAHTRRLARALDDYANADDYSVARAGSAAGKAGDDRPDKPVPCLRAVV